MPADLLLDYLKNSNDYTQNRFQVVFQCAPVLKGVKASNIITLPRGIWQVFQGELQESGIFWQMLSVGRAKEVVLLYRPDWIGYILKKPEISDFLKEYGYMNMQLSEILTVLQNRYQAYSQKEAEFPHELGIFLQYPLEDVKAFIKNKGKNCLMNGYWKVYHNPDEAQRIFHMYDRVREKAAKEFMSGVTPSIILGKPDKRKGAELVKAN